MIDGKTLGVDATTLEANAALRSIVRRDTGESYESYLKELARKSYSHEKALRRFLAPDLLILDDFALRRLDTTQSNDIYEVVIERHRRSSTILTSNRHVDEWIPLFDDPILAQSALDRLSHNAYQVQIEGESYRKGQRPDLLASKLESVHQP